MNGVGFQHGLTRLNRLGEKSDIVANLRSRRIRTGLKQSVRMQETRPKPGSGSLHARALETIGQLRTKAMGLVFVVGGICGGNRRSRQMLMIKPALVNLRATLRQIGVS